ncbi:hypothetical protein ABE458_23710 [Pseudomonas protegens]|uniref:hypothetical protein n=1 Tax=Pseudomonas protegens TaxID=380021 RepID=UPI00320B7D6D
MYSEDGTAQDAANLAAARFRTDDIVGVPVTKSSNPLSPVLEFDAKGNEIMYRVMSEADFAKMQRTGLIPGTGETSISPNKDYVGKYNGVLVRITTKPGTSAKLQEIGVSANSPTTNQFPSMSTQTGKWNQTNARFKVEATGEAHVSGGAGVLNTQLGKGVALDIFNKNILRVETLR